MNITTSKVYTPILVSIIMASHIVSGNAQTTNSNNGSSSKANETEYGSIRSPLKILPNFRANWTSNYGVINWAGGWYGEVNNFISIGRPTWDDEKKAYALIGYWGRRDGKTNAGGLEFTFDGACAFSGTWWYNEMPNKKQTWTGECQ